VHPEQESSGASGEGVDSVEEPEELEEVEEPEELEEAGEEPEEASTSFGAGGGVAESAPSDVEDRADGSSEAEAGTAASGAGARSRYADQNLVSFEEIPSYRNQYYDVATIDEVLSFGRNHTVVREDDELIQIEETTYQQPSPPQKHEVKDLVDSVLGEHEEGESASGIEGLLSPASGLDLFPGGTEVGGPELDTGNETAAPERRITLTDQGLDYDRFRSRYRGTDSGIFKSLIEFTRLWQARVGGLLVDRGSSLRMEYALGIGEDCQNRLVVPKSSGAYRNILRERSALLLKRPIHHYQLFEGACGIEQSNYIGKTVFIPVLFQEREAYIWLGVETETESIDAFLEHFFERAGS
jgi:hypothetical protein